MNRSATKTGAIVCALLLLAAAPAGASPIASNAALPDPGLFTDIPPQTPTGRAALWPLVQAEAVRQGVPPSLADAVAIVETGYTPQAVGGSGEIGMMQVMPGTARQLGFAAPMQALFDPRTNIHYGVMYLARTWAASGGNACRALMKYRAGVAEERYSPLSLAYCRRARAWLATVATAEAQKFAANIGANTPALPNATDSYAGGWGGRAAHIDMAALPALAGIAMVVERGGPAHGAPGRGRIQAVLDQIADTPPDPHAAEWPASAP